MAKIYGQLESAQLENLSADPASVAVGYTYWNTTLLAPRVYDGTAWQTVSLGTPGVVLANIRASEGAGTTTLVAADNHDQVFNLSADRTVVLPTTSISKGERFTLTNESAFTLTVQASDASQIQLLTGDKIEVVALINTPVTNSDWEVTSLVRELTYRAQSTYNAVLLDVANVSGLGSFAVGTDSPIIPYQTADGSWHLRFNLNLTGTSSTTNGTFSIAGVSFKGTAGGLSQCVSAVGISGPTPASAYALGGTSHIFIITTAAETEFAVSGDVELNSKPTWAN